MVLNCIKIVNAISIPLIKNRYKILLCLFLIKNRYKILLCLFYYLLLVIYLSPTNYNI